MNTRAFRPLLLALALASLAGCVSSNFVATDPRFHARGATSPRVYMDALPDKPYRSVGIIEVSGPPAQMDLPTVLAEAERAGGEAGCDVVVDRSIHRVSLQLDTPRMMLAQYHSPPVISHTNRLPGYQQAAAPAYIPPPDRREFICGVFVAAPRAPDLAPPVFTPPPPA
jgi:hypothetical protein